MPHLTSQDALWWHVRYLWFPAASCIWLKRRKATKTMTGIPSPVFMCVLENCIWKRWLKPKFSRKLIFAKKILLHSRKVVFDLYDKHTIQTNLLIKLCHFILSFWERGADIYIFLSVLNLQFGGAIAFRIYVLFCKIESPPWLAKTGMSKFTSKWSSFAVFTDIELSVQRPWNSGSPKRNWKYSNDVKKTAIWFSRGKRTYCSFPLKMFLYTFYV